MKMFTSLINLLLLTTLTLVSCDWSQQYGNYRSTNYVELDSDLVNSSYTGQWNYTYPGKYSYLYNSPAVSERGVVFLPFLKYAPPTEGNITYDLEVRAATPNGSILWVADDLGKDESCSVIFLTNAVYISVKKLVVIGWTCAAAFPYYEKHGQIVGIDSETGEKLWKSQKLYDANDLSRISATPDVVYTSGGYDCAKDGLPLQSTSTVQNPNAKGRVKNSSNISEKTNMSQIYGFSLKDGSTLWTKQYPQTGCTSQTRLFPLNDEKHLVIFPVDLPDTVYLGGKLLALECDSTGSCSEKWLSDLRLCWDSTFAFSDQGVLYGGYGFDGNPDLIFGLDVDTGKKVFSNMGYCEPGIYPSGPAVDKQGQAYYSCGNRVFAVNSKGELLWKTDLDQTHGYIFYSDHRFPPAIVPHPVFSTDVLVAMNTNSTHLFGLFTSNGTMFGSAAIPVLDGDVGISEPPFVAGDRIYWIKVHYFIKFYLFSTPMSVLQPN